MHAFTHPWRPRGLPNPLPDWVPAPGHVAVLSVANGLLTNSFQSQVDSAHYEPFHSVGVVNAYSGSVCNPYFGLYGANFYEGGGHSDTNDNMLEALVLGRTNCSFLRLVDPTPLAPGNDKNNSPDLVDYVMLEMVLDGKPPSRHSYGAQDVIGPEHGGAACGTFIRPVVASGSSSGHAYGEVCHAVHCTDAFGPFEYERFGTPRTRGYLGTPDDPETPTCPLSIVGDPTWSKHVPAQARVYIETHGGSALHVPRWLDLVSGLYVDGTGTSLNPAGPVDGSIMEHIPDLALLLFLDRDDDGNLRIRQADVSVSNPSWDNTPRTISTDIPLDSTWCQGCWCPDNNRLIVGNVLGDPDCVYEIDIPATGTCTAERVPLPDGETIGWPSSSTDEPQGVGAGYKGWGYNPRTKSINFMPYAVRGDLDVMWVYRPRGT